VPELTVDSDFLEQATTEQLIEVANQVGIGYTKLDESQLRARLLHEGFVSP
jgi:hypothetical protein